jgi:uncharacterized membrane-anchored protein YhcB (DUF1043 family)
VETWAELLKDSPYIAMIIALAAVVVYLFRGKERQQTKYTEDLVKATGALQDLTAEYLKQSFADSAGWQDRYKGFEDTFKQHSSEDAAADARIEAKIAEVHTAIDKHETRVKEHVDRAVERIIHGLQR